MRSSNLFSKTLREAPSDAETISHQLLIRSGFIQQIASGIFSLLPLGNRSISKIRNIIREEINNKFMKIKYDKNTAIINFKNEISEEDIHSTLVAMIKEIE